MCGICGKIYFDRSEKVDISLIDRMTSVLKHRGPDDRGIHVEGHVGLGHHGFQFAEVYSQNLSIGCIRVCGKGPEVLFSSL